MISFLWGCWHCNDMIGKINFLSKSKQQLEVTIISIPLLIKQNMRVKVRIDKIDEVIVFPPLYAIWQLRYQHENSICAGQVWHINGALKPLHASLNEGGFDQLRFSLSQRIIGTFKNTQSTVINSKCSLRQEIINHYIKKINLLDNSGVIYALMFGERGLLTVDSSALLKNTGLSHLIAISGLHIGMSYLFGYCFARLCLYLLPTYFIYPKTPILFGLIFAFLYAWVSGFAIPATRALISLVLWIYIKQQSCHFFSWQWAVWSIGLIIVADPLAILSDSFWLSSFAVLAILYWFALYPIPSFSYHPKIVSQLIPLFHLQVGLLVLLAPIQIILFQGINFMSFWANLWLVPIVSWLVVPAIFLLFLIPVSEVQNIIFQCIDKILSIGIAPLPYLSDFWFGLQTTSLWFFVCCWLISGFIALGWHKTYIGLLGCFIALYLNSDSFANKPHNEGWKLTTLDVGHGLAVVIEQNGLAYLYDTGNRWPEGSSAQRQIIPYLKHKSITPIGIILSHNHLDHTGGVDLLITQYPWINLRSSFGSNQHLPCHKGQRWKWGILNFEVLWPEQFSKISHNDDSCVIQISDGYHKVLLTGDIEEHSEKAITAMYKQKLRSDIIFAPHHGSRTSSTSLFIRTVAPTMVLVSSARYSAWKIPSDKVHLRYRENNIKWFNTAESGQVTIWFKKKNLTLTRFRLEIQPRWYHLWFGDPLFPE
nr:DNA internalization-related competence protein ComEC/Rec2 [Providencia burhodogranariea]